MTESLLDIVKRRVKKQQDAAKACGNPLGLPFPQYREYDPKKAEGYADTLESYAIWREHYEYDPIVLGTV